jgi:hypothetical protein
LSSDLGIDLLRHRMGSYIVYSISDGQNFVSLRIGNFDTELLFNSHDKLYSVQRVKIQILFESRGCTHFSSVYFLEILHDLGDSLGDIFRVKKRLEDERATKLKKLIRSRKKMKLSNLRLRGSREFSCGSSKNLNTVVHLQCGGRGNWKGHLSGGAACKAKHRDENLSAHFYCLPKQRIIIFVPVSISEF